VKHIADDENGETVEVNWEGFVKEFKGVQTIYVKNAGKKDDYIDLRGTKSEVDIHLGEGNDTIYLGDGGGSVDGGDGNDVIIGGGAGLEIHGGAGQDRIVVFGTAKVFGGDGADDITGSDGDDDHRGWRGRRQDRRRSRQRRHRRRAGATTFIDAGLGDDDRPGRGRGRRGARR
jgi:Ca2+-binding RTX toxin-like protein